MKVCRTIWGAWVSACKCEIFCPSHIYISSRFTSQDVVSAFSIFDPKKIPSPPESPEYPSYGEDSVDTLSSHYGVDRPAQTLEGEEFSKPALTSAEVSTEWKTFRLSH